MTQAPASKPSQGEEAFPFPIFKPGYTETTLRLLIHAAPGVGKTHLCGTAADDPATSPVLYIDTEGGTLTIRGKAVDVVRVTSWNDIVKLITHLRKGKHKYRTIVLDSLTELQKLIMNDILRENMLAGGRARDPDIPEQRDWAKSTERVRKCVRNFRDMPNVHVIFTCLSKEVKDEATGVVTVKPMLPGQLADEVAGFIDVVGWLHIVRTKTKEEGEGETAAKKVEKIARHIMFQPTTSVIVKDRSGALGSDMADPTIPKIIDLILPKQKGAQL